MWISPGVHDERLSPGTDSEAVAGTLLGVKAPLLHDANRVPQQVIETNLKIM